jgi:hypothetical protein
MRISTLIRFLIGDRRAILEVAENPRAVWIGFIFVLSAALAREYDVTDLARQPWRLLLSLGASLGMAALLYGAIRFRMALRRDADRPKILAGFRAFLGLFWMTAPLAWLYAIPYEHFLSDFGAAQARVNTLGLVALWRVLLMSRIIAVITESWFLGSLAIVMFFADAAVLAALSSLPDPLIKLMSGAQLSGRDQLILGWTFMARFMGFLSMPIWAITGLIALFAMRMKWKPRIASVAPRKWPGGAFYVAVGSLLFWIALLPITQPALRLRSQLEAENETGTGE